MSLLRDISDSHDLLKSLAISLITAPLWYLSLYLIHPELFANSDFIFKVVFCSIFSMITVMGVAIFVQHFIDEAPEDVVQGTAISCVLCFIYKALYLFFTYSILFASGEQMYLYFYVVFYFLLLIFLVTITIIFSNKNRRKKKK